MGIEEALIEFNITIDEFYDHANNMKRMSYITEGAGALVFDGDSGTMVVSYIEGVVTYELVDCKFFEDFSGLLPKVIEELKLAYDSIEVD